MSEFRFSQVDVFASGPISGNPVAVVHDADSLSDAQMAAFARWTNLSETTFLLAPTVPQADYRLRIFTPGGELPFAGHPTLGSAFAWLAAGPGGLDQGTGTLVQECGLGLVTLHVAADETLSFAAPELLRSGEPRPAEFAHAVDVLGLRTDQVLASNWIDNGPGWLGLVLDDAQTVLDLQPDFSRFGDAKLGVIGTYEAGRGGSSGQDTEHHGTVAAAMTNPPADYEVRAFCPGLGVTEDPVTGSLNAGFATWLIPAGMAPSRYTVSQGTAVGRAGRVQITSGGGHHWVGGQTRPTITGTVNL